MYPTYLGTLVEYETPLYHSDNMLAMTFARLYFLIPCITLTRWQAHPIPKLYLCH